MIPIIGIQNTMATFAGQNMGARQPERVSKGLGQGVLVSVLMTAALCLCQLLGMELIIRAFKLDAAAAAICRQHLFASVLSEPIFAIYFPANGMFQGVGEGFHATFYALMALGLRVVFAYSLYRTCVFRLYGHLVEPGDGVVADAHYLLRPFLPRQVEGKESGFLRRSFHAV